RRGSIVNVELKNHSPLIHPPIVAETALEQVAVGEDQLLAAERAHPSGLQADAFDRTELLARNDEVADFEGFVEDDTERGKQIAQNVLHRERHRNAPDPQTGDESGDVDTEDVEAGDEGQTQEEHPRNAPE